jgi:outer membrane protein OmpA-like peptidoglycan-associated protein
MDTEFPGTVFSLKNLSDDFYYKTLQKNVNELKLIQLGITLTNKDGEYPKNIPYHTWQFNFKFNVEKDKYSEESLNLLKRTGIDFDKLKKNGIEHKKFGKFLQKTGLVLNPNVKWIIRVDGHTDNKPVVAGTPGYRNNLQLSMLRANAVVDELAKNGVSRRRLVPSGFGDLHPIELGNAPAALQKNRRIELQLTNK